MNKKHTLVIILIICGGLWVEEAEAGLAAYGICQSGCNAVWVACVAAAGGTAGVSTGGVGVPAAILACNSANGICMVACIAAGAAPTPWKFWPDVSIEYLLIFTKYFQSNDRNSKIALEQAILTIGKNIGILVEYCVIVYYMIIYLYSLNMLGFAPIFIFYEQSGDCKLTGTSKFAKEAMFA